MVTLIEQGQKLKNSSKVLKKLNPTEKNDALLSIIKSIEKNATYILEENQKDIKNAKAQEMAETLIDRLSLNQEKIDDMIASIKTVISLKDPVSKVFEPNVLENGLFMYKKAVPLGVIGIIYESRPNVTIDATVLGIKSGNAILLRGSSSAINSNKAIVKAIRQGLMHTKVPEDSCILIEDTNREIVEKIIKLDEYIDLIIPRGGAGLIDFVTKNATVKTIETGVGNCHLYIDKSADFSTALKMFENGKIQRPSVCNSIETLLVHKDISDEFLHNLYIELGEKLDIYGCEKVKIPCKKATETEYKTEFLDYVIAIKVVDDVHQAIEHIEKYSSGHSECIVTNDIENANIFTQLVDSSCVYVNASTRFTDGGQFGFGCEMGISTQKMHVRGPFALEHLVSYKYIIQGNGQIRG